MTFVNGTKVDEKIEKVKGSNHGTTFSFIPNEVLMSNGDEGCKIEPEDLREWIEMIAYLLPEDNVLEYTYINEKGKKKKHKYENDGGQLAYLKKLYKGKLVTKPFHFSDTISIVEEDRGQKYDRTVLLEVAVAFKPTSSEITRDSFCNFVNTIDRGTHMDAVEQTIANEIVRETRENLPERDRDKLEITRTDAYSSMIVTINVNTDINPQFSGQVKEKVNSTTLSEPLRRITREAMRKYMVEEKSSFDDILRLVRSNARSRMRLDEEREAESNTRGVSKLELSDEKKYIAPRLKNPKKEYSEIMIVEGESAGRAISQGYRFQGALQLKGVPINALTRPTAKVITNNEIRTFIVACGTGIGKAFVLEDFVFDKVIIMTDGDIDGNKIYSSFLAFLVRYMPELIEAGRVYRVLSPLYEIRDKKRPFILSRMEYSEVFVERIGENIKLETEDGTKITKPKFMEFLSKNDFYLEELRRIAKLFKAHPDVVEFVILNAGRSEAEMVKLVDKTFDELTWENGSLLTGIYQGEYHFLHVNKRFVNKIKTLMEMVADNDHVYYNVYIRNGSEYMKFGHSSIGQLLAECERFKPVIKHRFKGLGELTETELTEQALSPSRRILVRITMDDVDEALETMYMLHGGKKEHREARKRMIDAHVVRRDEIDN